MAAVARRARLRTERARAAASADAVRSLLVDWIRAEAGLINEFSGDLTAEYKALVAEAQQRAEAVGVPWSDDLVPVYVSEAIRWERSIAYDTWPSGE